MEVAITLTDWERKVLLDLGGVPQDVIGGAAFNATVDFLQEFGYVTYSHQLTSKGLEIFNNLRLDSGDYVDPPCSEE